MKNIFKELEIEEWLALSRKYDGKNPLKEKLFHPVCNWACPPIINFLCVVCQFAAILSLIAVAVFAIIIIYTRNIDCIPIIIGLIILSLLFGFLTSLLKYYDV